jgi:hypothetical protein
MKYLLVLAVLLTIVQWTGCELFEGAKPIPADKRAFVGTWESKSGFIMDIHADGRADLTHNLTQTDPDYEKLCITVGAPAIKGIEVKFLNDTSFEVFKPLTYAKVYTIQQLPAQENHRWTMVLNGVTLTKR